MKQYLRVYQNLEIEEIQRHLLLIDDLYGSCANCKQVGLNYTKDLSCSQCKTEFKYLATKLPQEVKKILARLEQDGRKLIVIDRDDFDKATAKNSLDGLFN